MTLETDWVHPSLAPVASALVRNGSVEGLGLPEPQRLVAEALIALLGSNRMPDEMRGYAEALNAALDYPSEANLESLRKARSAAGRVESARSGMACENALFDLWSARDDIRDRLAERP